MQHCVESVNVFQLVLVSLQVQPAVSGIAASSSAPSAAPKPTFPAYTQSAATAAPSTSNTVTKPGTPVTSKPATLTTNSATSKLIHPDEDISLVSEPVLLNFAEITDHLWNDLLLVFDKTCFITLLFPTRHTLFGGLYICEI